MATSDVVNALNEGVGRLSRRPLWVGAIAFLLLTAVGTVALMSVAIGVLATLRVAYTTSIDRGSHVASPTDQRLTDRQARPQTVTPISPVVLPNEARGPGTTGVSGALPRSDLPSSETAQPAAAEVAPASSRSDEAPARSTLTDLIEAQSPPNAPVIARSDNGEDGHPTGLPASPAARPAAASGEVASSASTGEAAPSTPSAGSSPAADMASNSVASETDEIGRLATAPLPVADTAAALSHLRHVLKRRTQARTIKHTVHKPAPRTALQNNNYRPFDPFQPATPPVAGTSTRQKTW